MSKHPEEYLKHILDEINYLLETSKGINREKLLVDDTLKRAFARSLGIIGEATKKLPTEYTQKYPTIDWKSMAGMRDKLIHDYFGVDYEIVWDVVVNELPRLKGQIYEILKGFE